LSRLCDGPAPYPSTEIAKLWTRSFGMAIHLNLGNIGHARLT
jgi:hypothetical protein